MPVGLELVIQGGQGGQCTLDVNVLALLHQLKAQY